MKEDDAKASQPTHRATLRKRRKSIRMNQKRTKLLKGIASGLNVSEAGRAAGYSHAQSAHEALRRMENFIPGVLNRIGCPIEKVLKKLDAQLEAKETEFAQNRGIFTDKKRKVAHDVQQRAAIELAKLHRAYPRNGHDEGEGADRVGGPMFMLVLDDGERAARIIEAIAAGRVGSKQPALDVECDENKG